MANIQDVASKVGLSVTTVSRVLNNRGYISEKTRKKVYEAMEELNYQPNEIARALFRKSTNIIGVIVPSVGHPFFGKLVEAIETYASTKGYKIMLCNSFHERNKEIDYIQMLKSNKVDGIIIGSRSADLKKYMESSLPFVSIDRILNETTPCVSSDNYQGARLATTYLIEQNCRKLAFIGGTPSLNLMANQRQQAFVDVCTASCITNVVVPTAESHLSAMDYTECIENLLQSHPDIDGIFASSDIIAAQVLQIVVQLGRKVPQDIKIVGFDDIILSRLTSPQITTVHQPVDRMGKCAVDFILRKMKGEAVPMRMVFPVTLIKRGTT